MKAIACSGSINPEGWSIKQWLGEKADGSKIDITSREDVSEWMWESSLEEGHIQLLQEPLEVPEGSVAFHVGDVLATLLPPRPEGTLEGVTSEDQPFDKGPPTLAICFDSIQAVFSYTREVVDMHYDRLKLDFQARTHETRAEVKHRLELVLNLATSKHPKYAELFEDFKVIVGEIKALKK